MSNVNATELFRLDGKVALVTGGARDLGFDMAVALAQFGAEVIVTSRTLAKAEKSAAEIRDLSDSDTLGLELDHCDWPQVQRVAEQANEWKGRLDILVNNAGGGSGDAPGNLLERPVEEIDYLLRNNLLGPIQCCKAFGAYMVRQGSGKIINIASIAAVLGRDRSVYERSAMNGQPIEYAAAKAGIIGMTRDLAGLFSPLGVLVNAISPGGFDKGLLPETFVKDYGDATMLGHMGRMGLDMKGVVVFLASSASDYITGANVVVDGGFSIKK